MPAITPAPKMNNCMKAEGLITKINVANKDKILRVQSGVSDFAIDITACKTIAAANNFSICKTLEMLVSSNIRMP